MCLAIPAFILVVCGGLSLGRSLVTKHNLESVVAHVTRTAAIANQRTQSVIDAAIKARMGTEAENCTDVNTQVQVVASTVPGSPDALQVTATCVLVPLFKGTLDFGVDHVTVVVAMPLPI